MPSVHRVAEALDHRLEDRQHGFEVLAIVAVAMHRAVI
jgi:hypothetical protein